MDDRPEPGELGAVHIRDHPILGALPDASTLTFTFDGAVIAGREGEPIAAALFAAGIRVLRTMPRFGDSRGGFCMTGRCTDCMVVVNGVSNVRACVTRISPGLEVRAQHGLGAEEGDEPGTRRA